MTRATTDPQPLPPARAGARPAPTPGRPGWP